MKKASGKTMSSGCAPAGKYFPLMDYAHGCLHKGERRGIPFASMMCQELALDPQGIQDQRVVSQPPCMTVGVSKSDPVQQCVAMRD